MNTFSPVGVLQDFTPRTEAQVDTPELIVAAQDVLMQGLGLLFELGDRTYSLVAGTPFNASVGQHYRHVLEHFQSNAFRTTSCATSSASAGLLRIAMAAANTPRSQG